MAKDLLDMIDFSNLECLNEKPQHPASNGMQHNTSPAANRSHTLMSLCCVAQC